MENPMTSEHLEKLRNAAVKLAGECGEMQKRLARTFKEDDITVLAKELSERVTLLARAGKIRADAKYILDSVRGFYFVEINKGTPMSATTLKEALNSECVEEQRLYDLAESNYSVLVHGIDGLRSLLSTEKQFLANSGRDNTKP